MTRESDPIEIIKDRLYVLTTRLNTSKTKEVERVNIRTAIEILQTALSIYLNDGDEAFLRTMINRSKRISG